MKKYEMGKFVRMKLGDDFEYKCFMPNKLPEEVWFEDPNIAVLLERATQKLGELNAYAILVPEIEFFIKMHEVKEATESSRIEGTKTEIDEAVLPEEEVKEERRDDWVEVQNYIKALKFAKERMADLPIATRLVKETHKVLMEGARGGNRAPGEIRRLQNWVGGSSLKDAKFVPPPHTELDKYLSDLDNFLNDRALKIPILIKAALMHYQFETLHPFLDGNGRMGRLMIIMYLMEKKKLSRPVLYLSEYLAKNRQNYYAALDGVREGDLEHFVKFFLVAVEETASKSCSVLEKIIELREKVRGVIISGEKRVASMNKMIDIMYRTPCLSVAEAALEMGVSRQTANDVLRRLSDLGVVEVKRGVLGKIYIYREYLDLFKW